MLLSILVTWLSINFGLPAIHEYPRVEFVTPGTMAQVRFNRLAGADRAMPGASRLTGSEAGNNLSAIYDDRSRTIYLRNGWSDRRPADVSLLVHELVHHLQNAGGVQYDCPAAREKPAYAAQTRWLELFARDLSEEFALDPMTILVRTNCFN